MLSCAQHAAVHRQAPKDWGLNVSPLVTYELRVLLGLPVIAQNPESSVDSVCFS